MDEVPKRRRRVWMWVILACAAGLTAIIAIPGALAYHLYKARFEMAVQDPPPAAEQVRLQPLATGGLAVLSIPAAPEALPVFPILGPDGEPFDVTALRGRVVVLNTWAMWCRPCRTELPTLAALDAAYGDEAAIVTLNVDRTEEEIAAARALIGETAPLVFHSDPTFEAPFRLPGRGAMPQTVLIDKRGRMRAWLAGEADWSSAEVRALVDALLAEAA